MRLRRRRRTIGAEEGVFIREVAVKAIRTMPAEKRMLLVHLGGRLTSTNKRWRAQLLLEPEQAADMIAEMAMAGHRAHPDFRERIDAALAAAQERLLEDA